MLLAKDAFTDRAESGHGGYILLTNRKNENFQSRINGNSNFFFNIDLATWRNQTRTKDLLQQYLIVSIKKGC